MELRGRVTGGRRGGAGLGRRRAAAREIAREKGDWKRESERMYWARRLGMRLQRKRWFLLRNYFDWSSKRFVFNAGRLGMGATCTQKTKALITVLINLVAFCSILKKNHVLFSPDANQIGSYEMKIYPSAQRYVLSRPNLFSSDRPVTNHTDWKKKTYRLACLKKKPYRLTITIS
jgi:hypothetical protein